MKLLHLANMSNGLVYTHDSVCYFQSNFGHQMKLGYFNRDAMPLDAIIHLLKGGELCITDASQHYRLTDALKYGVPTWCAVFNRAARLPLKPCDWFTPEMQRVSKSKLHRPLVHTIRKLIQLYGFTCPASISSTVHLVCHLGVTFDDKVGEIRGLVR